MSLELCSVKEEVEECVSEGESASLEAVCVKSELELGPELIQPQDAAWALRASTEDTEIPEVKPNVRTYASRARPQLREPVASTQGLTSVKVKQEWEVPIKQEVNNVDTYNTHIENQPVTETKCNKPAATSKKVIYKNGSDSEKNTFLCKICQFAIRQTFENKLMLKRHMTTEHNYCLECDKQFDSRTSYSSHVNVHLPFECHFCTRSFATKRHLADHQVRNHCELKFLKCTVCNSYIQCECELRSYIKKAPDKKSFSCSFCASKFYKKWKSIEHVRSHFGPYVCDGCDGQSRMSGLRTYSARNKLSSQRAPSTQDTTQSTNPTSINFSQNTTNNSAIANGSIERPRLATYSRRVRPRLNEQTSMENSSCVVSSNQSYITAADLKKEPEITIKNDNSEVKTADRLGEEESFSENTSSTPTREPSLVKATSKKTSKVTLKTQIDSNGPKAKKKRYKCKVCKMIFVRKQLLKGHMWTRHESVCIACHRQFESKSALQAHTDVHLPYSCVFCERRCYKKRFIKSHCVTVHVTDQYSASKCKICKKHCTIEYVCDGYMKYVKDEEVFECGSCEKKCRNRSALLSHFREHCVTFICKACTERLKRRSSPAVPSVVKMEQDE